ncbi:MAG: hypothetical protein V2A73_12245 [Pseudomonadota bacterium]
MLTVKMQATRVLSTLKNIPGETGKQLRSAMNAVGKRYIQIHKKMRLQAPAPPHSKGRSAALGIHGTTKRGGFLKGIHYKTQGDTLPTLRMEIYTRGMIAKIHEEGRTLNRRMAMPMPIAKDRWGRLTPKALHIKSMSKMASVFKQGFGRSAAKRILGDKTFLVRTKDGREFAAIVVPGASKKGLGRFGRLQFWFHYEKQATWRPKLGFYPEWRKWLGQGEARKKFFAALQAGVKRAQGKTT